MDYLGIILGLFFLVKGGDMLMRSAVSLSLNLNISKIVIGMTVVSFATSAPELIVSIKAASQGYPDLALGNVIGSNIANLGLVMGIVILISPIKVTSSFYKIDWPMMIFASLIFYFFIVNDNILSQFEGGLMFVFLIVFLIVILFFKKNTISYQVDEPMGEALGKSKTFLYLTLGGFFLWLGSEILIKAAVDLATEWGVGERIISISVVSIGTSIPELSASLIAIYNKEKAISIGNLIGSNIFNILAVMGITSLIRPIEVTDLDLINKDFLWMLFISFLIFPLVFFPIKMRLGAIEGFILIGIYIFFLLQMFFKI